MSRKYSTASEPMPRARLVPPPPDWPHPDLHAIVAELDYGPLGLELWHDYRLTRLLASGPLESKPSPQFQPISSRRGRDPTQRMRAWSPGPRRSVTAVERMHAAQNAAPELTDALRTFAAVRRGATETSAVSRACAQIADWAAERSLTITGVEFARAAAAVSPDDPETANLAALMLRRSGDWKRAEQFYMRAVALARCQRRHRELAMRRQAKVEFICGHIGLAAMLYSRGVNLKRAVKHLNTAARVAAEENIGWLAAHVRHDRMLLLLEGGEFSKAEAEAERAIEIYPLHDSRFPFFASDFALVQVMQHRYSVALPLLELCFEVIDSPAARAVIASMLARAHAALGRSGDYEQLRTWAVSLAERHPEHSAAIHYHLAEAARACRSWSNAVQHAEQAWELASARGDRLIMRHAERVQQLIHAHVVTPPLAASGPDVLVDMMQVRLRRWNPANHRGRPQRVRFRSQWVA